MPTNRIINGIERRLDWIRPKTSLVPGLRMSDAAPRAMHRHKLIPYINLESLCPSVLDQLNEGSCAAFMGIFGMMYQEHLGPKDRKFAAQMLYYAARVWVDMQPADQDTGLMIESVAIALEKFGVCWEETWPYGSNPLDTLALAPSEAAMDEAAQHKALLNVWCPTLAEIHAALALKLIVGFGMDIPSCFEDPDVMASGELPYDVNSGFIGGHAMTVIGKDDNKIIKGEKGANLVRNQWGKSFGLNGDIWIPYKYWTEGVAASNLCIHRAMS